MQRNEFSMSNIPKYFHEKENFSWAQNLEQNWKQVQQELQAIINEPADFSPNENWLAAHPHYVKNEKKQIAWKTYEFIFFGIKRLDHCQKCPHTFELLKKIPQIVTAQYSVMEPHTHILPHKGYSRMVLRSHLGLIIPDITECYLRVGDKTEHWEEGKLLIFDDSYEHEAWNKSGKQRAVLMFDIANPEMNYTAEQICRYKIEKLDDPFLLKIADKKTWIKWFEEGHFPMAL